MRAKPSLALASVLVALAALSAPADAACKKFGFTVNDYGKEGPTNDAKNLLDKHISEWAAQNGVAEYQTGKKNVSCELFLDVILFDEHTCTASATVCWGDGVKPNNKTGAQTVEATEESGDAPPAPVRKADALGIAPAATAAMTPAAAPAATTEAAAPAAPATPAATETAADTAAPAAPVAPVEQAAAPADGPPVPLTTPATTPAATPPSGAAVETGTLQAGAGMAAPVAEKRAAPVASDKDRAAAAAAAASAAAAAERAAVAAETAASAAKEAAAAAVAASAASKAPATVPPLDHASGAKAAHAE